MALFDGLGLVRSSQLDTSLARALPAKEVFVRGLDLPPNTGGAFPRLSSPFAQHAWVYSCIRTIFTTFVQAPLRLWRGEIEIIKGPLFDLLHSPTPGLGLIGSGSELWQITILFLELAGNALWWLDNDGQRNRIPRNILVFHPKFFSPIVDRQRNLLVGYRFTPGGARTPMVLSLDEVVHFRYVNPDNPWWGIGPLQVARLSAEQDFKAASYNNAFFENSAEPGGLMLYKGENELTELQKGQVVEAFSEQHQGAGRAFKLGVLPGRDWDYKQLGLSQKDMEFLGQRKWHKSEIGAIFDVPPLFMGEFENSGLSDAGLKVQTRLLWETNLIPKGIMLQNVLNADFISRFDEGVLGLFDYDLVAALKQDFTEKINQAKSLVAMGWPLNQVNEQLDLGFDSVSWGDDYLVPISLVPAADLVSGLLSPEQDESEMAALSSTGQGRLASGSPALERARVRYWRLFVQSFAPVERRYQARLSRYFYDLRSEVLSRLTSTQRINSGEIEALLFDSDSAARLLRALSRPFFLQSYTIGGHQILGELGSDPALFVLSQDASRFLEGQLTRSKFIVETLRKSLRRELLESLQAGETLSETSDRIRRVFNLAANRARVIARTEIGQSVSGGRFESMKQQRVESHQWLSSRDDHVREAHQSPLDGEVVVVGEKFSNGLRFPLDPESNDPGQIISCRCTTIPVTSQRALIVSQQSTELGKISSMSDGERIGKSIETAARSLASALQSLAQRPATQSVTHMHMPASPPPQVTVQAPNIQIEVPTPQVNMEVQAPNIQVETQPPSISVNVPPVPARNPRSRKVERDSQGFITRIIEEEEE